MAAKRTRRPTNPEHRTHRSSVSYNDEEWRKVTAAARKLGLEVAVYIRMMSLRD